MDLEERKRQLAELKAAREAKQRQMERLAQNVQPPPAASPSHSVPASVSTSAAPTAASASPGDHSSPMRVLDQGSIVCTVVTQLGEVDVPPIPPVEVFDREVETDYCYVYQEMRPHPSEVVPVEEHDKLKKDLQSLQEGDAMLPIISSSSSPTGKSKSQDYAANAPLFFWDKSSSNATAKVIRSVPFADFVSRAVHATRRARDISAGGGGGGGLDSNPSMYLQENATLNNSAATKILRRACFFDSSLCSDRVVVSMCFQPKTSDYFLAAMSSPESGSGMPGLVLLWSSRRQSQVPLKFVCREEIRVVTFSPFHEHLIIAGTASGRIVCWNVHHGELPTLISFPSPDAHCSAILSATVRGDANSNQLVTVCQEGIVCTWQTDQPRRPLSSKEVTSQSANSNDPRGRMFSVASFLSSSRSEVTDTTRIVLGCVDGSINHSTGRGSSRSSGPASELSKSGVSECRRHEGAVGSIDCHPPSSDPRISELFLTSAADSTARLWMGSSSIALEAFSDHVYDLKWCPVNAALFAAADATGKVTLWNLTVSTVSPIATICLRSDASVGGGGDGSSPNTGASSNSAASAALVVQWDDSGEHLLCGTSMGEVFFLDVSNVVISAESARSLSEWVSRVFLAEA